MNTKIFWGLLILLGLGFWTYKVIQTTQAYGVARSAIESRSEIEPVLGTYTLGYDWWFGLFRAVRYGHIQEFEFHLQGDRTAAIAVVEVSRVDSEWVVTCLKVVHGEFLNQKLIDECGVG